MVCPTVGAARDDLRRLRSTISRHAARYGLAPIAASCHPFSDWKHAAPHRQGALSRPGARSGRRRPAPADLRLPRAHRDRRQRPAHRPAASDAVLPPAPARPVDIVAVLAGRRHRAGLVSHLGVRQPSAHGTAAGLPELGGAAAIGGRARRPRHHRGLVQDLVGHPAVAPLPDARDAHHGRLTARRGRPDPRRASRSACCGCCGACAPAISAGGSTTAS